MEEALPRSRRGLEPYAAPRFVCVMRRPLPPTPPTTHEGVEGLVGGLERLSAAAFESVRAGARGGASNPRTTSSSLVDQVAADPSTAASRSSQPSAMLIRFDDGQVTRIEFHLDRDEALRAAGSTPG